MGTGGSKSQGSGIDAEKLKQQAFGLRDVCAAPRRAASSRSGKGVSVPVSPAPSTSSTMGSRDARSGSVRRPVHPPARNIPSPSLEEVMPVGAG